MLNKIKIILLSRIKKPKEESWIQERRRICASCEFNSLNQEHLSFKVRVIRFFSELYSYITGRLEEDNLGNCTACEVCSIYFLSAEEVETCKKDKWASIYISNSSNTKNGNRIKNK